MINRVILIGRLGKDPETKMIGNSSVSNFSLCTSEKFKDKAGQKQDKTEWHNIVVWKRLAEIAQQYLKKGSLIYLEGKIQTRMWEKGGEKKYSTEIVGNQIQMLGSKREDGDLPI